MPRPKTGPAFARSTSPPSFGAAGPSLSRTVAIGLAVVGLAAGPRTQEAGEVGLLLDRLGRYLIAYEADLATVIASESYEQQEIVMRRFRGADGFSGTEEGRRRRKLESEVAFLRLPGGSLWFGVRDVRKVDGKAVGEDDVQLRQLLKQLDRGTIQEAAAKIIARSSQYNLGGLRTVNMPTTPLEILHPIHHVRFMFNVRDTGTIDGTRTRRLDFKELDEPTIISSVDGGPLFIRGSAWLEPDSGRLWRVSMTIMPRGQARRRPAFENRMRVDYFPHPELRMMVPKELQEHFATPTGRGEGRARYTNFRQFATSARILPQP